MGRIGKNRYMHTQIAAVCIFFSLVSLADTARPLPPTSASVAWNSALLQAMGHSKLVSPISARAVAIVHTCMYDAWAAYDERALGTQLSGALRRPESERTLENKEKAISYAAYRALADVLPADTESLYKPLMKQLEYDPNDHSTDIETPTGIGNVACAAVLEFRHHDKSNQLGDLAQGAYSDWTHYRSVNMPIPFPVKLPVIHPVDMNHWQPLIFVNSTGDFATQMFTAAHWCFVTPFALNGGDEFRSLSDSLAPATYGSSEYRQQAEELVDISAKLTEREKAISEYWTGDSDPAAGGQVSTARRDRSLLFAGNQHREAAADFRSAARGRRALSGAGADASAGTGDQSDGRALGACTPRVGSPRAGSACESRRRTPSAPASKRATSPAKNCGPIATTRPLISSCTPLPDPKYTRMGAAPEMVFTLLASPVPA